MTDNKHAEAVEAVALLLYNRALLALGLPARDSFYGLDDPDGYREDARIVIKALSALNTRPDVEAMRGACAAFLEDEANGFRALQDAASAKVDVQYRMGQADACLLAATAIRSIPVPTSGEGGAD